MKTPSLRDRLKGAEDREALASVWQEVEAARRDMMSSNTFQKCKKAFSKRWLELGEKRSDHV